jgi:hypothetical protein
MRLAIALSFVLSLAACGHSHGGDYATLQECMVDHTVNESLPEVEALAVCLVDHLDVSFATQGECEAYVAANGGYPSSAAMACMIYLEET